MNFHALVACHYAQMADPVCKIDFDFRVCMSLCERLLFDANNSCWLSQNASDGGSVRLTKLLAVFAETLNGANGYN